MSDFHKVRGNGCILYFPTTLRNADLLRGGKGYVVDLDAPLEREWCKDQMHKLEPAPDAKAASEIVSPVALRAIREEKARLEAIAAAPANTSTAEPVAVGAGTTNTEDEDDLRVVRPTKPAKPAAKAS